MKVYIGVRKAEKAGGAKGKMQYGMTVYSSKGEVLHNSVLFDDLSPNKFENMLNAILWATKKFKVLTQNKTLNEDDKTYFILGSKTILTWFAKEVAPEPYTVLLSDIYREMVFVVNPLEILHSDLADKKVLYREPKIGQSAKDLFSDKL